MEKLKRGGFALMQTIQGQPPIPVRWVRAKESARIYTGPNIFRHKYYGTSQYANVDCDCDGQENATFNGLGMHFPFRVDECGCPDWYPRASDKPAHDCAGLAPLGSDAVARRGADPTRDPIFVTGPGGLLPCCQAMPQFVAADWVNPNVGPVGDNVFIPAGYAGDLLLAIGVIATPTGPTPPPGWVTFAEGVGLPHVAFHWIVYYTFLETPDATSFRWEPFHDTATFLFLGRYRWADSPYGFASANKEPGVFSWPSVALRSEGQSTVVWAVVRYLSLNVVRGPQDSYEWPEPPLMDDDAARVFARDDVSGLITPVVQGFVALEDFPTTGDFVAMTLSLPLKPPS